MNKRKNSLGSYDISRRRYKELCGFVEQYPEWREALAQMEPSVGSPGMDGMPHGSDTGDTVPLLAIRRAEIETKIDMIESAAREADHDFAWHILQSVCYGVPFYKLRELYGIPLSPAAFYDRRRYFFYLLSLKR